MAASDNEARKRIIKHMNADHRDSVMRYLEYYAKVPRMRSSSAELKDVDLTKMTIVAGGRPYNVPFTPPLSTYQEVRERVVQMDQESIKGLNRSPVTIKEYLPPKKPVHVITLVASFLTLLMYSRQENLFPGSAPYEAIFKHVPQFAEFAAKIRPYVLSLMLAIHGSEAILMTIRLEKHSVPLFSRLWWAWVVSNFIEGVGAFQRINEYVKQKEKDNKH